MTIPAFQEKYAATFRAFTRTSCFTALIQTLESEHPVKKLKTEKDGDKLHGAAMFLARIDGFETCMDLLREIAAEPVEKLKEPETTYTEEETV